MSDINTNGFDFWAKTGNAALKFGSNDTAMTVAKFFGKMTHLEMTNPLAFMAIEASHGLIEAGIIGAIGGQKNTPGQFVQNAVRDMGVGFALHTGTLMGLKALAKSKYGSGLAGDAVDSIIK